MKFGNMGKMMKQIQKMQEDMQRLQDELKEKTVTVTVGGGAVKAVATGGMEIRQLEIDPAAVDPGDIEMLQDLIVAAVNEALRKAQDMVQDEMQKVAGKLPPLPGLGF